MILITAFNDSEYLNEAIKVGADSYLMKPIEIDQLKNVLYSVSQKIADKKLERLHYEQIERG